MNFGEFTNNRKLSVTEKAVQISESLRKLVWRFVENHCSVFVFQTVKMLVAALFVHAQKAFKCESACFKSRNRKCGNHGTRTGNHHGFYSTLLAELYQIFTRIGNARHSGVRYNCTIFALFNSVADDFATLTLVVFKIAYHRLFYAEMIQELKRYPCVLCRNEINRFEGFYGSR